MLTIASWRGQPLIDWLSTSSKNYCPDIYIVTHSGVARGWPGWSMDHPGIWPISLVLLWKNETYPGPSQVSAHVHAKHRLVTLVSSYACMYADRSQLPVVSFSSGDLVSRSLKDWNLAPSPSARPALRQGTGWRRRTGGRRRMRILAADEGHAHARIGTGRTARAARLFYFNPE